MFTLILENSKIANLVYSFILDNFNTLNLSLKIENTKIIFNFNGNIPYKDFSLFIVNLIINFYEEKIIKKILNKNYFYFTDDELQTILDTCNSILAEEDSKHKLDLIYLSVFDYVSNNSLMDLSGFIQFRLKDYIEILDYLVDLSVNNFIINREYLKFIELLQDYISSSEPKIDIVHLIYLNKESILLDGENNVIPVNEHILDAKYLSDISFSSNDYSLNTLLNLLPEKLCIHILDKEDEFINTIKKIFKARVSICYNCDICNFYKSTSNLIHSDCQE